MRWSGICPRAGAPCRCIGLPALQAPDAESLDGLDLAIEAHGPPDAGLLAIDAAFDVEETLHSALLKSNCPVTGQPDWADVFIAYRGPRIQRVGLLRYLVGFRDHAGFHEQCVGSLPRRGHPLPSAVAVGGSALHPPRRLGHQSMAGDAWGSRATRGTQRTPVRPGGGSRRGHAALTTCVALSGQRETAAPGRFRLPDQQPFPIPPNKDSQ